MFEEKQKKYQLVGIAALCFFIEWQISLFGCSFDLTTIVGCVLFFLVSKFLLEKDHNPKFRNAMIASACAGALAIIVPLSGLLFNVSYVVDVINQCTANLENIEGDFAELANQLNIALHAIGSEKGALIISAVISSVVGIAKGAALMFFGKAVLSEQTSDKKVQDDLAAAGKKVFDFQLISLVVTIVLAIVGGSLLQNIEIQIANDEISGVNGVDGVSAIVLVVCGIVSLVAGIIVFVNEIKFIVKGFKIKNIIVNENHGE